MGSSGFRLLCCLIVPDEVLMKTCLKPIVVPLQGIQQGGSEGRNIVSDGFFSLGSL